MSSSVFSINKNPSILRCAMSPAKAKKQVSFSDNVAVIGHENLLIATNFHNRQPIKNKISLHCNDKMSGDDIRKKLAQLVSQTNPCISSGMLRKEGDNIAGQLEKQGVLWKNYEKKLCLS